MQLPIQKSAVKTMPVPIQKSATSNYAAADPEIGSLKLFRCRLKNWLPKALLLPILKSTAKYCAAVDPEISTDGGVVLA
jgi:hypothetical protein